MSQNIVGPPRLATGSHPDSKIYMCGMNVISWENGDKSITDTPECTPIPLARIVHYVNDSFCAHIADEADPSTGRRVRALCADCAPKVLALAHRTVGLPKATLGQGWMWLSYLLRDVLRRNLCSSLVRLAMTDAIGIAYARAHGRAIPQMHQGSFYGFDAPPILMLANLVTHSGYDVRGTLNEAGMLYAQIEPGPLPVVWTPVGSVYPDDAEAQPFHYGGKVERSTRPYVLETADRAIDLWIRAVSEPMPTTAPAAQPETVQEPVTV